MSSEADKIKSDFEARVKEIVTRDRLFAPGNAVPGRANTDLEKQEVLDRLANVWMDNPTMRLGQLITNEIRDREIYNIEDFDLLHRLEEFYGRFK